MLTIPVTGVARSIALAPASWLSRTSATIGWWRHQMRSRRHLALLSDHLLDDIGLDRRAAAEEIGKPFWQR